MTLVLYANIEQLFPMLLFAQKLRSCWCFMTNLTLQNILIFLPLPPPQPQEFSDGNAGVTGSSALKGLIESG